MSFNIMTLGGMAAAVGLIIDDAIVMIEHIVRRMHEGADSDVASRVGMPPMSLLDPCWFVRGYHRHIRPCVSLGLPGVSRRYR